MTKSKKPDDPEEMAVFRQAMRGIKPLSHTKVALQKKRPPSLRPKKREDESTEETFAFSDHEHLPLVTSEDFLEFARSGPQHKILRNMRQGHYEAEAILDLHGKTSTEARESLSRFLLQCQRESVKHALIIHGKGRGHSMPILKNKLNHWLRQTEHVLAFCTATPKHGGSGALYVLLRR